MASQELGTIHELHSGFDLRGLTPRQRRAAMESVARPAPEGTVIDPVEANGVSAEWVAAAGVGAGRVLLFLHRRLPCGLAGYAPPPARPRLGRGAGAGAQPRLPPRARAPVPGGRRRRADRVPLAPWPRPGRPSGRDRR